MVITSIEEFGVKTMNKKDREKEEKEAADKNELDYCPVCQQNKMVYVGRADSYWCYGCEQWHNYDDLLRYPW